MPDVKHCGGFGPLLDVLTMSEKNRNLAAQSVGTDLDGGELACGRRSPELVRALEYSFQRAYTRGSTGEVIENGVHGTRRQARLGRRASVARGEIDDGQHRVAAHIAAHVLCDQG
jgi:hypothetical protein